MAPARGAWKSADMPAASPAAMRMRLALTVRFIMRANALPQAAPISVTGPSYPADPPKPTVRTDATDFTGITAAVTYPSSWWYAFIALSVPLAISSRENLRMRR